MAEPENALPVAKLVNLYELKVEATSSSTETAAHLLVGRQVVAKHSYRRGQAFSFFLREPGTYRVKLFTRHRDGTTTTALTQAVRFLGLRDVGVPEDERPVALVGVSRTTAAVLQIVRQHKSVTSFLDPTGQLTGTSFFGRDIVGYDDITPETALWVPKGLVINAQDKDVESFSLETGARDVLSAEVIRLGVIEMHRKSRDLYEQDLIRGATYLQNFIFHHFSCRLPYKARLGEGTRLGYNGLGTVLHPESVVGKNCVIAQNVTLGSRGKFDDKPAVGDNVYIGPGAKCLGGRIGNNVVIGANAVVLNEVPDNCVVAGVPAKVISRDMGSYASYTGISE
jgi:serine O-acetyltransferase